MTINLSDIAAAGFCMKGARRWFDDQGFDFKDFARNGMPVHIFVYGADPANSVPDPLALQVLQIKKARENG